MDLSDMLIDLRKKKNCFEQIMSGLNRIKDASQRKNWGFLLWLLWQELFRRLHGKRMNSFNYMEELLVFLKCSTDGFKEHEVQDGDRMDGRCFILNLNYSTDFIFKASEALLASFIPGMHDSNLFDSLFSLPIIELPMILKLCISHCVFLNYQ